jgi:protein-S-isoprenylcysteine O-methyltransferase Ste14
MVAVGNFLFHWRNMIFPVAGLLLLLPGPRLFPDPLQAALLGAAVATAGELVRVVTIGLRYVIRGGRGRRVYAEDLVTEGVYQLCRNPMYVGNVLITAGVALASNSLTTLACALPLVVFIYSAIVAAEEAYLRDKFGDAFDAYCRDVPRWLPKLAEARTLLNGSTFHWRRVIVKEYGTPFAWIVSVCGITIYNLWRAGALESSRPAVQALLNAIGVAALCWLAAWVLKKTRWLVAD